MSNAKDNIGPLAQLVEQQTLNLWVEGSNPSWLKTPFQWFFSEKEFFLSALQEISMTRHHREEAIVLTSRQFGEDNRIITFLSPRQGIFESILYGGRKSKLRSVVSPWHSGTLWFYVDNVKNTSKITDFSPSNFRPSLREHLYKNLAASLATELIIKTKAAGENNLTWTLFCGFLDGLEISEEEACKKGLLRFLWRYIGLLGVRPSSLYCCHCGTSLQEEDFLLTELYFYSPEKNGFLCPHCCKETNYPGYPLSGQALEYLQVCESEFGAKARNKNLSDSSEQQLKQLLFYLISSGLDIRIKTLETTLGIL